MCGAKSNTLQDQPSSGAASQSRKLALQISTEDEFFAKPGSRRYQEINDNFCSPLREKIAYARRCIGFEQMRNSAHHTAAANNYKYDRNSQIPKEINETIPSAANQFPHPHPAASRSVPDERGDQPFDHNGEHVARYPSVFTNSGEVCSVKTEQRQSKKNKQNDDRVPRRGHGFVERRVLRSGRARQLSSSCSKPT